MSISASIRASILVLSLSDICLNVFLWDLTVCSQISCLNSSLDSAVASQQSGDAGCLRFRRWQRPGELAEVELPPVEGVKLDPVAWSNVIDELALRRSPIGSPLRRWPRR